MKMTKKLLWIMAVSMLALALCSCTIGSIYNTYENADQYTTGDAEISGNIDHLDIGWLEGSVKIEYHAENTVIISETSTGAVSDETAVHWWLDGSTLRIRYAASNQSIIANLNKQLTVILPETQQMEGIHISSTSADIECGDLSAEQVELSATSGDIAVTCTAENIHISATSGDLKCDILSAKQVELSATSGDITATCAAENICMSATSGDLELTQTGETSRLVVTSTSGNIYVQSEQVGQAELGSTSGEITISCGKTPTQLDIDSTSGDIKLCLPEGAELTAEVSTTTGRFDTELAMKKDGSRYICGNGSSSVVISTTSGDVFVSERK